MLSSDTATVTADDAVLDHEDRFTRLDDLCRTTVEAGAFATSLIVSTATVSGRRDRTFGTNLSGPVDATALCELHCLTKPIVGWALLEAASRHGMAPTEPVRQVLADVAHLDQRVTVAAICNHLTRIAQPSGLDWVSRPPPRRPGLADLQQEPGGSWYSEVGAWMVAAALMEALSGRPAVDVVADFIDRCEADAYIGTPLPPGRRVITPVAGLPFREIPMLHVEHPTYRARLGPEFGGFGSMPGYVRFLEEVGRAIRGEPSAIAVDQQVLGAVLAPEPSIPANQTWRRPARFVGGFLDGGTPNEPGGDGMLLMFAGIGNAACLLDPCRGRQIAYYSDAASFDPSDHQFLRRQLLGTFLEDPSSAR